MNSFGAALPCVFRHIAKGTDGLAREGISLLTAAAEALVLSLAAGDGDECPTENNICKESYTKYAENFRRFVGESLLSPECADNALFEETAFLLLLSHLYSDTLPTLSLPLKERMLSLVFLPAETPEREGMRVSLLSILLPSAAEERACAALSDLDGEKDAPSLSPTGRGLFYLLRFLLPFSLLPERFLPESVRTVFREYGELLSACLPTEDALPLPLSPEYFSFIRLALFLHTSFSVPLFPIRRRFSTPLYTALSDALDAILFYLSRKRISALLPSMAVMLENESPVAALVHQKAREVSFFETETPTLFLMPRGKRASVSLRVGGDITPENGRLRKSSVASSLVSYKGGFLVSGSVVVWEGDTPGNAPVSETPRIRSTFAVAALPDDETVLCVEALSALTDTVTDASALSFSFPMDEKRVLYANEKRKTYRRKTAPYTDTLGSYLNIEDELGIVTNAPMRLTVGGNLATVSPSASLCAFRKGDNISRAAAVLTVGGIRRTRAACDTFLTLEGLPAGILSASAVAANRKRYTLLLNTTDDPFVWDARTVPPQQAVLLSWDRT